MLCPTRELADQVTTEIRRLARAELGALTGPDGGFTREQIGKINVTEFTTFVAVQRGIANEALRKLNAGKVKGKNVKARLL